jgi:hypothetical protein
MNHSLVCHFLEFLPHHCGLRHSKYLLDLPVYDGKQPGDPKKLVEVILDLVRGEGAAQGRKLPLNLALGSDCLNVVRESLCQTKGVLAD